MTREQVRAARALLDWTVRDLAAKAGVHRNTVSNLETGRYAGDEETIKSIRKTLEKAGVVFIAENGGGAGVRLRK